MARSDNTYRIPATVVIPVGDVIDALKAAAKTERCHDFLLRQAHHLERMLDSHKECTCYPYSQKGTCRHQATPHSTAFMRKFKPSFALGEIVGHEPQERVQITRKLWDYIKSHRLQDKTMPRMINSDKKLKLLFGRKNAVSMFTLTKIVNKHLHVLSDEDVDSKERPRNRV